MKKLIYPLSIMIVLSLSAFVFIKAQNWKISEGYSIKFSSKDPSGTFTSLKGDIQFDESDLPGSKFNVTVDANSINTGNGMKNSKAKSASYLDTEKYPEIKFVSSSINKKGASYEAKGYLTLHGVAKEITVPFTYAKTDKGGLFTGSFNVNRNDYKVGEPGGHAEDILAIDLSIPVSK
jgi:polyisoprenoid-binding protein YceI